jgi:hypothetical protein
MADHADDDGGGNNNVFIYMGGDQEVPEDVTHVRVHKSVKIITLGAFRWCKRLVSIEMHDGVEIIEEDAFSYCTSLREIKLSGVRVIGDDAFYNCRALTEVEFGDELEIIGGSTFGWTNLRSIKLPNVRSIGSHAFYGCKQLTDVELSIDLETIEDSVFDNCRRLRRIAMPLKANLLENYSVFNNCYALSQVDLVGGIHKTVSSLLLQSWRNEMNNEIDCINRILPNTPANEKTRAIQHWMERVIQRIEHYKSEHYILLKEDTTQLELAIWKVKLDEEFGEAYRENESNTANKAKIDMKAARQVQRITSGASIVIKNVLPFLKLE